MIAGLLNVEDVAQILGISVRAVYRLTEGRKLASIKWGRSVRVAPDDLAIFIHNHREEAIDLDAEADTICV